MRFGGGVILPSLDINLPYFIDSSLTAMPFFFFGYLYRGNLYRKDKKTLFWVIISFIFLVCFSSKNSMRSNFYDNLFMYHITSLCGIYVLINVCRYIGDIPIISNVYGRYSLIVLCTHPLLINPIRRFAILYLNGNTLFVFFSVTLLELLVVPFILYLFPYFCAQKKIFN